MERGAGDAVRVKQWMPRTPPRECGLRVVCFHGAGCSDSVYTLSRIAGRVAHNPFLAWAQDEENDVQLLGVQLPGREQQLRTPAFTSIEDIVDAFVADCRHLFQVPYVLVGHSVGSWVAHGVAKRLMQMGCQPPLKLYVAAFPPPTIPHRHRPWNKSSCMSDEKLQEEAGKWGVNPVVFQPNIWATYGPLFRADFRLFDEQQPLSPSEAHLGSVPLHITTAAEDERITPEMTDGWRALSEHCCFDTVQGEHLFVYNPAARATWFDTIIKDVESLKVPRLTPEALQRELISAIVAHTTPPPLQQLAASLGETLEAVHTHCKALPGMVTHEGLGRVLEVPPFSLVPAAVCIRSVETQAMWWAKSVFDALGAAATALAEEEHLMITTTVAAEQRQVHIAVRYGRICGSDDPMPCPDLDDGGNESGAGIAGGNTGFGSRVRTATGSSTNSGAGMSDLEAEIQRALQLEEQAQQQQQQQQQQGQEQYPQRSRAGTGTSTSTRRRSLGASSHQQQQQQQQQQQRSGGEGSVVLDGQGVACCYVYFPVDPVPLAEEATQQQDVGYGTALLLSNKHAAGFRKRHGLPTGRILPLADAFDLAKAHFAFAAVHEHAPAAA